METYGVTSSFIDQLAWEADPQTEDSGTVTITFKDGKAFNYYEVSREDFTALRDAPSVGSWFHRAFKRKYVGSPA